MSENSWRDAKTLANDLAETLADFDWSEAERQCRALIQRLNTATDQFPAKEAAGILKDLRRKRRFTLMATVADAFIDDGRDDAEIRRQYGQAQIELGQLTAAETTLRQVVAASEEGSREWAEAMGLLGRIYKQRYVDAQQPRNPRHQKNLRQALSYYLEVYKKDRAEHYWHGINAVALLARAERDQVDLGEAGADFRQIAKDILQTFADREKRDGGLDLWSRATSMEAHVALGEFEQARDDLRDYALDPAVDAFECASTLRQLREVWQLDDDKDPGMSLIEGLKRALLRRQGGEIDLRASEIMYGLRGLQANFSGASNHALNWWRTGLMRCEAVARIDHTSGDRVGSGFLVRREDFLPGETGPPLLLTNWHVVSHRGEHLLSIPPETAVVTFEACDNKTFKVAKTMPAYCSRLDASFLELENADGFNRHCPLEPVARSRPDKKARLYVIGYPGGRNLSFSIHDSVWLDSDDTRLHYRTPTEPGSSGSPVFDDLNWTVVGIHHEGLSDMRKLNGQRGTYAANEGISIAAIQTALKTSLRS
jgi:Trypsin-like peptidase domain/MAP3K TRAFs-binding domain